MFQVPRASSSRTPVTNWDDRRQVFSSLYGLMPEQEAVQLLAQRHTSSLYSGGQPTGSPAPGDHDVNNWSRGDSMRMQPVTDEEEGMPHIYRTYEEETWL